MHTPPFPPIPPAKLDSWCAAKTQIGTSGSQRGVGAQRRRRSCAGTTTKKSTERASYCQASPEERCDKQYRWEQVWRSEDKRLLLTVKVKIDMAVVPFASIDYQCRRSRREVCCCQAASFHDDNASGVESCNLFEGSCYIHFTSKPRHQRLQELIRIIRTRCGGLENVQ